MYGQQAKPLVELAQLFSWAHQKMKGKETMKQRGNRTSPSEVADNIKEFDLSNDLDEVIVQYESPIQATPVLADKRSREPTGDKPPGSVCSEFMGLPIHQPISSKRHHYNPHTLDNTANTR